MKFHYLAFALLFLVSCQSQVFQGSLKVSQDLNLGDETIYVGEYSTKISITGRRKLEINVVDGNQKTTVEVRTQNDIKTYIKNDMINIPSKQSDQSFDIAGTFVATSVLGQKKRDYEQCTYQEPYTVCVPSGPRGEVRCHTEYRTRHGLRDVEFKLKTTTTDMKVAMHAPKDPNNYYADFTGVNIRKQRIYSYEGFCR